MDDLSVNLKKCPTGCTAGGAVVNHLMYADDIVLLSPSATGLSLLLQYLGHVISADMKDDLDIMRQCRQLYAQGNAIARRFHMCSDNVKATLFRSYCSSLYTSQLWWKYRVNSIRKLYVAYNNAFRMLFRLPRHCSASVWAAVFTFNPYLLISINGIIDINNSFIDINKYGHIIHLY